MRPRRTAPVRYIVWHCSATRAAQDVSARDIDGWHRARGWDGIGYHIVIRRSGAVELGEDLARVGAHTTGHNYDSVGVCMVGGLSDDGKPRANFTPAQWDSAIRIVHPFLARLYPTAQHLGHRDLSPDLDGDKIVERHEWTKQCPCFEASATFRAGAPVYDPADLPPVSV